MISSISGEIKAEFSLHLCARNLTYWPRFVFFSTGTAKFHRKIIRHFQLTIKIFLTVSSCFLIAHCRCFIMLNPWLFVVIEVTRVRSHSSYVFVLIHERDKYRHKPGFVNSCLEKQVIHTCCSSCQ